MATINLNSIQDFFETGINYCVSKVKEITPIIPYSFTHLKQVLYNFNTAEEMAFHKNHQKRSYLKNIPGYALSESLIDTASWPQDNGTFCPINNGIYYIVLVDLVGSTKYLAKYGNERAATRIINFVQAGVETFISAEKVNKAYFLKEVGDSVLFIFTHVSDVVQWQNAFNARLAEISQHIDEPYEIRTCVHLGEVCLHDANPLCLSVSETFKMEKQVQAGKLVFSELAARVASPSLNGSKYKLQSYENSGSGCLLQELVPLIDSKWAPS